MAWQGTLVPLGCHSMDVPLEKGLRAMPLQFPAIYTDIHSLT